MEENDTNDVGEVEEVAVGLGCALEGFGEAAEIDELIRSLDGITDEFEFEKVHERYRTILDRYQEQPHLLDRSIPDLLLNLLNVIRTTPSVFHRHSASKFAYLLFKVRGFKVVVRQLPHEVQDVEPVLTLLEEQNVNEAVNWETTYVLLLWLSMLVLIPFHMSRFDSGAAEKSVMDRILLMCQRHLLVPNKNQDAAAFVTAKFLTRPEIVKNYLPGFLDWGLKTIISKDNSDFQKIGALKAIATIFKHGKREDVLPHTKVVLEQIVKQKLREGPNVVVRKLTLKLIQRLGLTFLKAKVAKWRYNRGSRSLAVNLADTKEVQEKPKEEEDEEDYDIPDEIEEVIDELLQGLRDGDTIVRWSAAKGIGRLTGRLPQDLADEVVESLLEIFTLRETDVAWHGGCLALAELGRRGLLLPQRLDKVVGVVSKSLVYDEKKGTFSVGSHVRDAACYVCWAFARAYDPADLKPFVNEISSALLTVAVFDREVNCRRAASAAFQENVGRQGTFPHGIEVLTKADYFTVGSRNNSYLSISVYIAQFEEYTRPLIEHLLAKKVGHWDVNVRELTSKAFFELTANAKDIIVKSVLPELFQNTKGIDLPLKHGSILAIGEIVHGLATVALEHGKSLTDFTDETVQTEVSELVGTLVRNMSLRGSGGELLRQAVAVFIENCSKAKFPCDKKTVNMWQVILDENLSNPDPQVQSNSTKALVPFLEQYYDDGDGEVNKTSQTSLVDDYISQLEVDELHRRGFALALGSFPKIALAGKVDVILKALIRCTKVTQGTEKWAEGRRDAMKAISMLTQTLGISTGHDGESTICESNIVMLYDCYLQGLADYTIDRRGDIGAWVREAAMSGLLSLTLLIMSTQPKVLPTVCIEHMMPALAQQAVEKIDRTRGHAAAIFATILRHEPAVPGIPDHEEILGYFPKNTKNFAWTVESATFPIFCRLVHLPAYRERMILGLVVSVGGLTERLVKHASECLQAELQRMDRSQLDVFGKSVLSVFEQNQKVDRVTVPMLKFLDQLLTTGYMDEIMEDAASEFPFQLFSLVKAEVAKCGEPNKLMAACDVLCALLQSADEDTVKKALVQLSIFLCHRFPRIRKVTASKTYEALLTYSDKEIVPGDKLDEVMNVLSDTNWDQGVEVLRPVRNDLCAKMGINAPALVKKPI